MNKLFIIVWSAWAMNAFAQQSDADQPELPESLEEVTIIGQHVEVHKIAGSAHYLGPEDLEQYHYSDIQRLTQYFPGVSVQIEDGYGLRPNIGIRGVATERSGRITLLEDNVLIAPAPYSAPSAYYFPTIGRIYALEVVKGPAAITQGPYTIGGALNMVSTPIPEKTLANVYTEIGVDNTVRLHAYGGKNLASGFGFLVETHQWQSDGFQSIDRSNNNTGLDISDYTVKLAYAPSNSNHSVELKWQVVGQDSNQSYLGLTDSDFRQNPYRRYGISSLDSIDTDHEQFMLAYRWQASEAINLTTTFYNNTHERKWFKTEGIDLDGSNGVSDFSRTSWANIITAVNRGQAIDGQSSTQLHSILVGEQDTAAGSIQLRDNNREYFSRGMQVTLDWDIGKTTLHELQLGVRLHSDEEDRLQRNSTYQQINGALQVSQLGEFGNAGNRIQEAQAFSFHLYDRIQTGKWTLTPGLRYEDIDQERRRFNGGSARTLRDMRENNTSVVLPGMGVLYAIRDNLSLVAGAHKGFTAPSNAPNVRAEEALNYELGIRYKKSKMHAEMIAFLSDYDNILGECTASSGANCEVGDAFNGDAATVQGVEALLSMQHVLQSGLIVPINLSYTYIDSSFDTDIADTDFFGNVQKGDPIPYIPTNQLRFDVGVSHEKWHARVSAHYVGAVCVRASCDNFEKTDASTTMDLAASLVVQKAIQVFLRVENLTAEESLLGRHPYGARPNKARTFTAGFKWIY